MGIAVIGSVFIDIKGFPDDTYVPEGRNAGHIMYVHGGVCRNVAENIGRAGLKPLMIGLTDPGGMGQDVIRRLESSGVDTSYMRTVSGGCGTWLVVFDSHGDLAASISERPDLHAISDILRECGQEIAEAASAFIVELDLESEILDEIYRIAAGQQKPVYAVVSNISIAMKQKDRLKLTDCFVCNLLEAAFFFQSDLESLTQEELCRLLPLLIRKEQIPRMVVTLGSLGAVYADQNGSSGFVPAQMVTPVDTSGAGDAFFSGVVIGLTSGLTLREACEIGTLMAASVITVYDNTVPPEIREILEQETAICSSEEKT